MSQVTNIATDTPETLLRGVLEANGQRFTEQRAAVYRFLRATRQHPTADEVFTAVRGEITDISLATVYKALETLVSCGLAIKLAFGDGSARYDARTDDHCHARCTACGIVLDVAGPDLTRVLPALSPANGFQVQGYRVEVVGLCESCAV
ncbi:peroxide-responsive transcriptional repressor PerR [soil metagenome]|nr:transcriptional repressor [Gemmatimonadota bacterium]